MINWESILCCEQRGRHAIEGSIIEIIHKKHVFLKNDELAASFQVWWNKVWKTRFATI